MTTSFDDFYPWISLGINITLLSPTIPALFVLIIKYRNLLEKPPKALFIPALLLFIITIISYLELIIITIIKIMDYTNISLLYYYYYYIENIFIFTYWMINYFLILSLYLRLYCIFKNTFVPISKYNNYIFISILIITPFIDISLQIIVYYIISNNNKLIIIKLIFITICQLYHIILIISLIYLFLNKLYKIYKNNDNDLLLQVTTKTTTLMILIAVFTIFVTIMDIFNMIYNNNQIISFLRNLAISIDIFSYFLYVALSFNFFHGYYKKMCGFIDNNLCKLCFQHILKLNPNDSPSSSDDNINNNPIPRGLSESLGIDLKTTVTIEPQHNTTDIDHPSQPKIPSTIYEKNELELPPTQIPDLLKVSSNSGYSQSTLTHKIRNYYNSDTIQTIIDDDINMIHIDPEHQSIEDLPHPNHPTILSSQSSTNSTSTNIQPTPIQIVVPIIHDDDIKDDPTPSTANNTPMTPITSTTNSSGVIYGGMITNISSQYTPSTTTSPKLQPYTPPIHESVVKSQRKSHNKYSIDIIEEVDLNDGTVYIDNNNDQ